VSQKPLLPSSILPTQCVIGINRSREPSRSSSSHIWQSMGDCYLVHVRLRKPQRAVGNRQLAMVLPLLLLVHFNVINSPHSSQHSNTAIGGGQRQGSSSNNPMVLELKGISSIARSSLCKQVLFHSKKKERTLFITIRLPSVSLNNDQILQTNLSRIVDDVFVPGSAIGDIDKVDQRQ